MLWSKCVPSNYWVQTEVWQVIVSFCWKAKLCWQGHQIPSHSGCLLLLATPEPCATSKTRKHMVFPVPPATLQEIPGFGSSWDALAGHASRRDRWGADNKSRQWRDFWGPGVWLSLFPFSWSSSKSCLHINSHLVHTNIDFTSPFRCEV